MCNLILTIFATLFIIQTEAMRNSSTQEIPKLKEETYYKSDLCQFHDDCLEPCGNFRGLRPRCDDSGVCVCDCSKMDIINSNSVPEVCKVPIPSHDLDQCVKYSGDTYNRQQAKMCGRPGIYVHCTCLCKYY